MPVIDRYIGGALLQHVAYALTALVAVFSIINLTEELRLTDVGYGVAQACNFILRTLPAEACRLLPAAGLLGAVLALGRLQNQNEIVALQAAGLSLAQLLRPVTLAAALVAAAGLVVGETVAGPLSQQAHRQRALALSDYRLVPTAPGLWLRDRSRFINVGLVHPDGSLADVSIYDFGADGLRRIAHAATAVLAADGWVLRDVHESVIDGDDQVSTRRVAQEVEDLEVDARQLQTTWLRPEDLSIAELHRAAAALRAQGQNPLSYELAFWQKVSAPPYALVMVLLAVPIVLASRRTTRSGERIVIGALVGLAFQTFQQMFTNLGVIAGLPAVVTGLTPVAVALGVLVLVLHLRTR